MNDLFVFPSILPQTPILYGSKYEQIIRAAFFGGYTEGSDCFDFSREQIDGSALGLDPKNIGDIIYSYRYRRELPADILACAPEGRTWIIEGAGDGQYRFKAVSSAWFEPSSSARIISVPDRTPDEVLEHRSDDEQAILANIAYNRLLDLFLSCRLERKQSHWRTKVAGLGQIEIDDVYVGVSADGEPVVVTVQAKRDNDKIAAVQIRQDILACEAKQDGRKCRPVAVHFDSITKRLACMEFAQLNGDINLVQERHYLLQKQVKLL